MSLADTDTQVVAARGQIVVHDDGQFANMLDTGKFEQLQRIANLFSKSSLVPKHFQGSLPNCVIACQMAFRLGVDPMAFMQNSYIVSNKCGIETKLATALLNSSGLIVGPITYKISGSVQDKSLRCVASCVDAKTREHVEHSLEWSEVVSNGWHNNDNWKKDPRLMIQYRSAMRLIRLHYSGVILGLYAKEELEDMETVEGHIVTEAPARTLTDIEAKLLAQPVGVIDHVGDGSVTWQQELAGCQTVADVERVRAAWGKLLTHEDDYAEMDAFADDRLTALGSAE